MASFIPREERGKINILFTQERAREGGKIKILCIHKKEREREISHLRRERTSAT